LMTLPSRLLLLLICVPAPILTSLCPVTYITPAIAPRVFRIREEFSTRYDL
jgi:hypothetical protein